MYDRSALHPDHLADLRQSGLVDETIARQKIRSVPPAIFDDLLGFRVPAAVTSMYVIPFFTVGGTLTDHIRVKVFPAFRDPRGQTVKHLQPRASGVRIYVPLATLDAVRLSRAPLYVVEGEKKSLAVAQLGLPTVGIRYRGPARRRIAVVASRSRHRATGSRPRCRRSASPSPRTSPRSADARQPRSSWKTTPTTRRGRVTLVLQRDRNGRPINVVWGIPRGQAAPAVLVTAYRPDPACWTDDFLRRR